MVSVRERPCIRPSSGQSLSSSSYVDSAATAVTVQPFKVNRSDQSAPRGSRSAAIAARLHVKYAEFEVGRFTLDAVRPGRIAGKGVERAGANGPNRPEADGAEIEVQAATIKSALDSLSPVSAQRHAHYRGYATIQRDPRDWRYARAVASRQTARP
jgi:hypothetical protein